MAKPKPKRIPSDDCPVTVNDEVCYPHEGEWVELFVVLSSDELDLAADLAAMQVDLDAVRGEPDENQRAGEMVRRMAAMVRAAVAHRIIAWNWTDLRGQPLPAPDGTADPLRRLSLEELMWLFQAGQVESGAERKKDSLGSPTTSSDTVSVPMAAASPGSARSRSKPSSR